MSSKTLKKKDGRITYIDERGQVTHFTSDEYKKFKQEKKESDAKLRELRKQRLFEKTGHDITYERVRRKTKNLKQHEIEDIAYHMVKHVENIVQKREFPKTENSWQWLKTLKYGTNKISFLKDEGQAIHVVVSGGKHNVNFNLEDEHGRNKFAREMLIGLGIKVRKKQRGGYEVYIKK